MSTGAETFNPRLIPVFVSTLRELITAFEAYQGHVFPDDQALMVGIRDALKAYDAEHAAIKAAVGDVLENLLTQAQARKGEPQ